MVYEGCVEKAVRYILILEIIPQVNSEILDEMSCVSLLWDGWVIGYQKNW